MPSSSKTQNNNKKNKTKLELKKINQIKQRISKCKVNKMTDSQFNDFFRDQIRLTRENNKALLNSMTKWPLSDFGLLWAEALYENHLYIAALQNMTLNNIKNIVSAEP